jgi:DHA1 family bicyclomycin/chloramphenicol resistance-like MFS transporter
MHAPRPPLSPREFVGLMAVCMAMAALSIDLMLPAFPAIREDFGLAADSTGTSWIVTAFFLGLAGGQVVYGPLSDRFGRKPLLYAGLSIMAVSAAATALAPTLGAVIAGRVLWGIGAAAPRSLALAMVRDTFTGDRMARTMSHVMATFVLVPVLAPSAGSAVLAIAPWRTLFWLPGIAAVLVGIWLRRLPETLPPARRRATSPAALLQAGREVVRTPQTVGFAIALTGLFGMMTAYLATSELIINDVFGRAEQFPVIFGALALFLAAGSFFNARFVIRLGLYRVLRFAAGYLVAAAALLALVAWRTDGRPSFALFALTIALLLPAVAMLMPNCNTAAMVPLPHVAGTAAAVLGTVSTAGGSLLGSVLDSRFDGTIAPFAYGVLLYATVAALGVFLLGLRPTARTVRREPIAPARSVGEAAAATERR